MLDIKSSQQWELTFHKFYFQHHIYTIKIIINLILQ